MSTRPTKTPDPQPLKLRRENGKCITVDTTVSHKLALIVWKKNGSPLLPLVMDSDEAEGLIALLRAAIEQAYAEAAKS